MLTLKSASEKETKKIGERLGRLLRPGDTVYLYGDLGAGKTVLVKGIAKSFGIPEKEVASASFTIVAEHEGTYRDKKIPFFHIDLYRLEGGRDAWEIGIEEYIGGHAVSVIEWAEKLGEAPDGIRVNIEVVPGPAREIIIEGVNEKDWDNRKRGR